METLPSSWTALCALAFVLGVKHGFDADHLATVDGITRHNSRLRPRLARCAGTLFSLGHGAVVVAIAVAAAAAANAWQPPRWLEVTGVTISLAFLFGLAALNLRAVVVTKPCEVVRPATIRGRLLGRVLTVQRPWAVAAVGALFAVSFDTVSQAALMSLAAERFGGLAHAVIVAVLFVVGMLVVDGLNGACLARLLRNADRMAVVASRVMALGVGALSIAVGLFTVAKLALPRVDAWSEGRELQLGASVAVGVIVAFAVGVAAARREGVRALASDTATRPSLALRRIAAGR
jgi:nickel/cobalt transporter (NiCoT) family protein